MRKVLHRSIVRNTGYGISTHTLCGRDDSTNKDGFNIAEKKEKVTCKHCLKAEKTSWGKNIIKQHNEFANK